MFRLPNFAMKRKKKKRRNLDHENCLKVRQILFFFFLTFAIEVEFRLVGDASCKLIISSFSSVNTKERA